MAISEPNKKNFETMQRAQDDGALCIMEATRNSDGKPVVLVCAMSQVDGMFYPSPLAVMIEGNPFDDFTPPEGMEDVPA